MTSVKDIHQPLPSIAYFILNRSRDGYTELAIDAEHNLFIRYSKNGKELTRIPLGQATQDTITQLRQRLADIGDLPFFH